MKHYASVLVPRYAAVQQFGQTPNPYKQSTFASMRDAIVAYSPHFAYSSAGATLHKPNFQGEGQEIIGVRYDCFVSPEDLGKLAKRALDLFKLEQVLVLYEGLALSLKLADAEELIAGLFDFDAAAEAFDKKLEGK